MNLNVVQKFLGQVFTMASHQVLGRNVKLTVFRHHAPHKAGLRETLEDREQMQASSDSPLQHVSPVCGQRRKSHQA